MWRTRSWGLVILEVLGSACLVAWGLSTRTPIAVVFFSLWAPGLLVSFALFGGRSERRWAAVVTGVLTALLVGGVVLLLVRGQLRKTKVTKATEKDALMDFRRQQNGEAPVRGDRRGPTPGVYRYVAKGQYSVSVAGIGKEKRVLPKTIPAVLIKDGRCWELSLRFFEQHRQTTRYCTDEGGSLRMEWVKTENEMFGRKTEGRLTCNPATLIARNDPPGHERSRRCVRASKQKRGSPTNGRGDMRFLAREDAHIDGRRVKLLHLRSRFRTKGWQSVKSEQHLWFDASTYMLVSYRAEATGAGLATMTSKIELKLASLEPKR
jgi:hypothetical protein